MARIEQVKEWLLGRRPEVQEIDLDTDLIETRVLSSLDFLEFVYFLEELTGKELGAALQDVSSFRTLRAISGRILDPGGGQAGG